MIKVFGSEILVDANTNSELVARWIKYGCPVKSKAHPGRLLWLLPDRLNSGRPIAVGDETERGVAMAPVPFQSGWCVVDGVILSSELSSAHPDIVYAKPEEIEPDFSMEAAKWFVKEGLA